MIKQTAAAALLIAMTVLPVQAQEPTLAGLRATISDLRNQLQSLRGELSAAGSEGYQEAGGANAIDRMNAMEDRLNQLTDQTEQLQNRIRTVIRESTARMDDLEFRLCEMDETCDLGALMAPDTGAEGTGVEIIPQVGNGATAPDGENDTASSEEQADFDAAYKALNAGEFRRAADMFAAVAQNHAGGPLTAQAYYLRGTALDNIGQPRAAATAWLEGFTADPDGSRAADSLLGIARVIEADGDPVAACLYLAEIPARFPGTAQSQEAEHRLTALDCASKVLGAEQDATVNPEAAADLVNQE
ncbi:tol-pal system protein [Paracoccus onubensis]|uniref:tetratricopeptide repeat protein n=1 Tax=Paracoccus onubensis TaxID=1675788 RepID=UPI002730ABD7|nr:tetratricopeptide repeat protein [Paracoccus onubensis]MDP0929797.1 tol-pal system protein [Paracoccus onubensis]